MWSEVGSVVVMILYSCAFMGKLQGAQFASEMCIYFQMHMQCSRTAQAALITKGFEFTSC